MFLSYLWCNFNTSIKKPKSAAIFWICAWHRILQTSCAVTWVPVLNFCHLPRTALLSLYWSRCLWEVESKVWGMVVRHSSERWCAGGGGRKGQLHWREQEGNGLLTRWWWANSRYSPPCQQKWSGRGVVGDVIWSTEESCKYVIRCDGLPVQKILLDVSNLLNSELI